MPSDRLNYAIVEKTREGRRLRKVRRYDVYGHGHTMLPASGCRCAGGDGLTSAAKAAEGGKVFPGPVGVRVQSVLTSCEPAGRPRR